MVRIKQLFLSAFCALALPSMTRAENAIILTYHGVGHGTLNGAPIGPVQFTITANADIDQREAFSAGWMVMHTRATISISGVGDLDFVSATRTFVNNQNQVAGFGLGPDGSDLLYAPIGFPIFAIWDLTTSVKPIHGSGQLLQWGHAEVLTSAGALYFEDDFPEAAFSATKVPDSCNDTEMDCGDGLDDDCDGLGDVDDPDCRSCEGAQSCAAPEECDDGNPCSFDHCLGGCCNHSPDCRFDEDCDDQLYCNGVEKCSAGCCVVSAQACPGACCETTQGCSLCCEDVQGIRTSCHHGKLDVSVRLVDTSHDRQTIALSIDGVVAVAAIQRGLATYRTSAARGSHQVCLEDPSCEGFPCRKVVCGR